MSNVGYGTLSIIPSARGFKANLDRQIAPALTASGNRAGHESGKAAGRGFGGGFIPLLKGTVGPAAGLAAGAALGLGIKTGLSSANFLQQAQISFKTLLGPGGDAQSYVKSLADFAKATPFDMPGVVSAARSLLGTGTAAGKVIPTLTALGDATGALGLDQQAFGSIVRAVTQVQSKGKFQAEEALQIAEAGLPIYPLLARAMGKTVPEIQAMMQAGKLLAKDALPALYSQMNKDYGGSMAAQSKTLGGVWSSVKDTISTSLGEAFLPLAPILADVLPPAANALAGAITAVSDGIRSLGPIVKPAAAALKGLFAGGGDGPGGGMAAQLTSTLSAVKAFGTSLLGPLKAVGSAIMGALGPGLKSVSQTLQTTFLPAFRAILPILAPIAGFIIRTLGGAVVGIIKGAFNVINGVLKLIGGLFKVIASAVKGDWSGMWQGIKSMASGAIQAIWGAIQVWLNISILGAFRRVGLSILGSWKGMWSGIKGAASAGWNAVKRFFASGVSAIGRAIMAGVKGYINMWKGLFNLLKSAASAGWRALRSAFGSALSGLRTAISTAVSGMRTAFNNGMTRLRSAAVSGIQNVVSVIRSLPGRAVSALGNIGSALVGAGRNLIAGFISGIRSAAGGIVSAIAGSITNKIPAFVRDKLGIHSPSRVFMEIGGNVGDGMALGIASKAGAVTKAADALAYTPQARGLAAGAAAANASPLVGSLSIESRGNAKADLEEALFQLRRIQRGGVHA